MFSFTLCGSGHGLIAQDCAAPARSQLKTRLRGSGYTNPRYPSRPKDIHLENLENLELEHLAHTGIIFLFLREPSLLIVQTQWSSASGPPLQSRTRTRHAAPRARPPPRPGGKETRRWDSEGGVRARMGGFSNAPRCPASLTFRDSPALLRQESDGYPVRPAASTPTPTAHSLSLIHI